MSIDSKKFLKKIIKHTHKYCERCRSGPNTSDGEMTMDEEKCPRCGEEDDIFLDGSDDLFNAIMKAKKALEKEK